MVISCASLRDWKIVTPAYGPLVGGARSTVALPLTLIPPRNPPKIGNTLPAS